MKLPPVTHVGQSVTNEKGATVHAREEIGFCSLARFFAIAILMCGTTASEEEIVILISEGHYDETAAIYNPTPSQTVYGEFSFAPELVEIDKVYTFPSTSHQYKLYSGAETQHEGTECIASFVIEAKDPSATDYQTWTKCDGMSQAWVEFDYVVYNKEGTDTDLIVPLMAKGTLSASLFHLEHGSHPFYETVGQAGAWIKFFNYNDAWNEEPLGQQLLTLSHNYGGDALPSPTVEMESWLLTVPILVGKDPGDRTYLTVRMFAFAKGQAAAHSNPDFPEQNSYSTIATYAHVDPFFYIDPTWEHADQFGLAFPDNVTPLTEDPGEIVFADGFDIGYTFFWSETNN